MISCIMVTQPGREDMAARAVLMAATQGLDVEVITINDDGRPLGALRNEGVARASFDLVATWDDDDIHSPDRLVAQLTELGSADAIVFDQVTMRCRCGEEFLSVKRPWECTMLARKSRLLPYRADMDVAEDHALLVDMAAAGRKVKTMHGPALYTKVAHDGNTIDHLPLLKKAGHRCSR